MRARSAFWAKLPMAPEMTQRLRSSCKPPQIVLGARAAPSLLPAQQQAGRHRLRGVRQVDLRALRNAGQGARGHRGWAHLPAVVQWLHRLADLQYRC